MPVRQDTGLSRPSSTSCSASRNVPRRTSSARLRGAYGLLTLACFAAGGALAGCSPVSTGGDNSESSAPSPSGVSSISLSTSTSSFLAPSSSTAQNEKLAEPSNSNPTSRAPGMQQRSDRGAGGTPRLGQACPHRIGDIQIAANGMSVQCIEIGGQPVWANVPTKPEWGSTQPDPLPPAGGPTAESPAPAPGVPSPSEIQPGVPGPGEELPGQDGQTQPHQGQDEQTEGLAHQSNSGHGPKRAISGAAEGGHQHNAPGAQKAPRVPEAPGIPEPAGELFPS